MSYIITRINGPEIPHSSCGLTAVYVTAVTADTKIDGGSRGGNLTANHEPLSRNKIRDGVGSEDRVC